MGNKENDLEAEEEYFNALEEAVPDIWTINKDPKWLEWLGQEDPLTGKTRQQLIEEAQNNLDANRVANFFKTFSGGNGKPKEDLITPAQLQKATQDRIKGKISEEEYTKICDDFQKRLTRN